MFFYTIFFFVFYCSDNFVILYQLIQHEDGFMKLFFASIAFLCCFATVLWSFTGEIGSDEIRIIVAFDSPSAHFATRAIIEDIYGGELVHQDLAHGFVAYVLDKRDYIDLKDDRGVLDRVRYIEKDRLRHFDYRISPRNELSDTYCPDPLSLWTPNDPKYSNQWGPPCISLETAWNHEQGNQSIIIAILDSGIDTGHPDLQANFDPDISWNAIENNSDVSDGYGHGTHVAGIACATTDNGIGIAGAIQCRMMILRVCNDNGLIWTSWVNSALYYAADNGAHVANMSFGGNYSNSEKEACEYCWNRGMVLTASAGNENVSTKLYPAALYTVIGVGALGNTWNQNKRCKTKAYFSNYNQSTSDLWNQNVALMAPGQHIISTTPTYNVTMPLPLDYGTMEGTSMAAPLVAAVAAGYYCYRPSLSNNVLRNHMKRSADTSDLENYDRLKFGWGRVDGWPLQDG
jgi:subtilisin family serine protease